MATRYTREGQQTGDVPRYPNGERIPHDQLHWLDEKGRHIPYYTPDGQRNLTYDHNPPVMDHWNKGGGNDTGRAQRNAWYDNPDHLRPRPGPGPGGNFSAGAQMRDSWRQDVGPNYSE
jgi:hypothetical protein